MAFMIKLTFITHCLILLLLSFSSLMTQSCENPAPPTACLHHQSSVVANIRLGQDIDVGESMDSINCEGSVQNIQFPIV